MGIIRMEKDLYDEMIRYAKTRLPEEACGLLAGSRDEEGKNVRKIYYLENTDHAADHFSMNPAEQLRCVKDMRVLGIKPLGNWHSHPSSPSRPSEEDIRLAYDKGSSYMILSFLTDHPVVNSFHIENAGYEKEDFRVYTDEYYF